MGFITRAMVPRSVRRAVHPVRAVRRAATPRPIKRVSRAVSVVRNPVSSAAYSMERSARTAWRKAGRTSTSSAAVYSHAGCTVNHRTYETMMKCRKGFRPTTSAYVPQPQYVPQPPAVGDEVPVSAGMLENFLLGLAVFVAPFLAFAVVGVALGSVAALVAFVGTFVVAFKTALQRGRRTRTVKR